MLASERDRAWVRDNGERFRGGTRNELGSGRMGIGRNASLVAWPLADGLLSLDKERVGLGLGLGGSRICSGGTSDSVMMMMAREVLLLLLITTTTRRRW